MSLWARQHCDITACTFGSDDIMHTRPSLDPSPSNCIFSRMVVLAMAILMSLEPVDCNTVKV